MFTQVSLPKEGSFLQKRISMEALDSKVGLIAKELENKGNLKQTVYRNTKEQFKQLKKVAKKMT